MREREHTSQFPQMTKDTEGKSMDRKINLKYLLNDEMSSGLELRERERDSQCRYKWDVESSINLNRLADIHLYQRFTMTY